MGGEIVVSASVGKHTGRHSQILKPQILKKLNQQDNVYETCKGICKKKEKKRNGEQVNKETINIGARKTSATSLMDLLVILANGID